MAGDWIKMELELSDKPEVHFIANTLNIDPDAVVGKLLRVWGWFDKHTVTGNAVGVTYSLLDRLVFVNGFAEAMALCGWLDQKGHELSLPNFERHNGKTAKNRALTAKRVAEHKRKSNAEGNGKGNAPSVNSALPREEKRRSNTPVVPFDRFWEVWPKKKARQDAEKAWRKLNPDEQLAETIISAVQEQSGWDDWIKESGKYIPLASGWLNGKRWEDEAGAKVSPSAQSLDIESLIRQAVAADRTTTANPKLDEACKRVGWGRLMGMDPFNRKALIAEVEAKYAEVMRGH